LSFDQVVIATGAWSTSLLKQLNYKLPIEPERGYSLDLPEDVEQPRLNRPVASAERKFIMTPMAHGLRLSGTVEFAGLTQKANMQRADMLYQHAEKMLENITPFSKENANDEQRWLGFRPSLPDSLPVIGKAPKHSNITLALGHQHLGLTLGAITGKLIGQIIDNQDTDIDIEPFCVSRFNEE
jgi:D-amino-acid dehydrogenase